MGTADVIPGVSGGTIALISGIYDRLISSLGYISIKHGLDLLNFLNPLSKKEKKQASRKNLAEIDWEFLIPLLAGIAGAVLVMSRIIPYMLDEYPIQCFSFFFGLIVFSLPVPFRQVEVDIKNILFMLGFASLTFFYLADSNPLTGSQNLFYVFLTGAIAISAMILPGISGSYMLLLMGEYNLIMNALHSWDLPIIFTFISGIIVGIYSFLKLLRFLLSKYHSLTMASMTGIMLGSLRKIWPYAYMNTASVSTSSTSAENHIQIIGLSLLGGIIVFSLDKIGKKYV